MSPTSTATVSAVEVLNKQVANFSVLYMKLHSFHWFVKGPQFFTLHAKFEELYTQAAATLDELAERVLAIKGKPPATLKEQLELASVKEAKGNESPDQMVKALIADYQTIISEIDKGADAADKEGDASTADLLTGLQTTLEKQVWMLQACMG
ncbi:Dps family protein [Paenibacillus koleovorans]|uniref:Dps family protein n=1 Tax=Paenibacillus koleovorans TaxID=121608 RepID=UPI000FD6FB3D|nr:DNA starvation/stationary phase protection protein [Paenibacillus koleovorans]